MTERLPLNLIKTVIWSLAVPGTTAVAIPIIILSRDGGLSPNSSGFLRAAGLALILAGIAVYARCILEFIITGLGTPIHFDPPRNLVARGPYRYTRNPMYLSVSLVIIGEALFFASPPLALWALAHFLLLHIMVISHEEPLLKKRFGASHGRYCREVPRWLPRPDRWKRSGGHRGC